MSGAITSSVAAAAELASAARYGAAARDRRPFHAKTFAADRGQLFIGSSNPDPRSMELDTELGSAIESADLATQMADPFTEAVPAMVLLHNCRPDLT
ncbi:phospholipase D-like domain-containing protein [uncultured Sphingomonas sp.]|uniref:phospholipase D-like domain-containing protein n=1 Tax=uncultured Sphingomonas sp. TaxID=158754 RepID=UPI0025E9A5CF|nr:phospholipase D-like domain-containing protein [uncultured Sphingomonas sp.]